MPTLDALSIRLACDQTNRGLLSNVGTSSDVILYYAELASIQGVIFSSTPGASTVTDISNIIGMELVIRKNGPRGTVIINKSLDDSDLDLTVTYADFLAGTAQHFSFDLTAEELSQTLPSDGSLYIHGTISAQTVSGTFTVGRFEGEIVDNGATSPGSPPTPNFLAYSRAQVDTLLTTYIGIGEVRRQTVLGDWISYKADLTTAASRGTALTDAIADHSAGDSLYLGPGDYNINQLSLKSDVTIEANKNATLRLLNQASNGGYNLLATVSDVKNVRVRGILFDCNLQNQTGTNVTTNAVNIGPVGIGGHCIIEDCHAINWGNKGSGSECFVFGIYTTPGVTGPAYGCEIRSSSVDTPAPVTHGSNGATAFDIFGQGLSGGGLTTVGSGWMVAPVISGCIARDITTGSASGRPNFFHAFSFGASDAAQLFNCKAINLVSGGVDPYKDCSAFYLDTWSVRRASIFDNKFLNVAKGIFVNALSSSYIADKWQIYDNQIDLNDSSDAVYGIFANGSATMTGWFVRNNIVDASYATPMTLPASAIHESNYKSDATALD